MLRRLKRYLETGQVKESTKDNKPLVSHVWSTKTAMAAYSDEVYALYRKYQSTVHTDKGIVIIGYLI